MGSRGRVVFVGAGPGDPRLLTLHGRDAIAACDVVFHDAAIDPEILSHAPPAATHEAVPRVLGADAVPHAEGIGAALVSRAKAGAFVVRVAQDDPFAGTGEREVRAVAKSGVPFEIVPGVHSATALAALAWLERRGLFGKRVLVTRAAGQSSGTARLLAERGAIVVLLPTIEIHPPPDPAPMERALASLGSGSASWDLVAFTSANGVEQAWAELSRQKKDARAFGGLLVAAIGPATAAALEARGVHPDVVAAEFRGEGLAAAILQEGSTSGARVLVLRALVARDALPDGLREAGCTVDVVPVYETKPASAEAGEALARELESGALDAVTLTSSSTATNLVALLGPRAPALLAQTRVASIGPITTDTAARLGIRVDVTADPYTLPSLIEALARSFEQQIVPKP
jgi:uroporphyrinogen III methyltransferase / synthase